jgi:outer membrane protein
MALCFLVLGAYPSRAETLMDALASVYAHSPDLDAARARVRAAGEGVPQATATFLPQVNFDSGVGTRRTRTDLTSTGGGTLNTQTGPRYVEIKLVQPLFDGFRAQNRLQRAKAQEKAEQEALRNAEQTAMYNAAEAYMRVIAANETIAIRKKELAFLREEVRRSQDRVSSGQASEAELFQARGRASASEIGLNAATAQLSAWTARYFQSVGHEPKNLTRDKSVASKLPKSFDLAVADALAHHPAIVAAQYNIDASRAAIDVQKADLMPSLNLEGSVGRSWDKGSDGADDAYVGLRLSVPLFSGGANTSKVREATERKGEAEFQLSSARNQVMANIQIVWGDYLAAQSSIASAKAQVSAQEQALAGIRDEERVGVQSPLDVLNAQSELVSAQINLVEANTQSVVSAYGVLAAIGRLDSRSLNLSVKTKPLK